MDVDKILEDIRRQGAYMSDTHKEKWYKKVDIIIRYIKELETINQYENNREIK